MDCAKIGENKQCGYPLMDILKFVFCFMVVLLHCEPPYYFQAVCRLAVPFFFVVSSFLFFANGADILKYLKRMSILYVVWFVIEIPFIWMRYRCISLPDFILKLFLGNTFYGSWYIIASIEAVGLVYLLSRKFSNVWLLLIAIALHIVTLFSSTYYYVLPLKLQELFLTVNSYFSPHFSFLYATLFIVIGKIAFDRNKDVSPLMILLCGILWTVEIVMTRNLALDPVSFIILPFLLWALLMFCQKTDLSICQSEWFSIIRKMSTLVYLIHPLVVLLIAPLFHQSGWYMILKWLIVSSLSCVVAYIVVTLSKRIRILKYLY